MEFPIEIERMIVKQTWAWRATLRPNWREGSSINMILTRDQWWEDYIYSWGNLHNDETWVDWCRDKMIIGPPRYRSDREVIIVDAEYMNNNDLERHYIPWVHTWPRPDDHSWCKVRGVPDWAQDEYCRKKK